MSAGTPFALAAGRLERVENSGCYFSLIAVRPLTAGRYFGDLDDVFGGPDGCWTKLNRMAEREQRAVRILMMYFMAAIADAGDLPEMTS